MHCTVLMNPEVRLAHEMHCNVLTSPEAQLAHEMHCILVLLSPEAQASS
jgi:hypothetical protein